MSENLRSAFWAKKTKNPLTQGESADTGTEDGASCFVHFTNIKRGMYDVGDNQYGNARAKNLLFVLQQLLKLASNTANHFFLVWLFVQVMPIARD